MVTITYINDGTTIGLKVEGHAGTAPVGEDLICAGCSTLAYCAAYAIAAYDEAGMLFGAPVVRVEPGNTEVTCRPMGWVESRLRDTMDAIMQTFELLQATYPDHVKVIS